MFPECIEQLMMMFPDMSRESLQDKLEAWNNDMQRVVTSILSSKEGIFEKIKVIS